MELTNDANMQDVLDELNEYFETSYTKTDIWSKKTTINNQFIYFRSHLSLFKEFIEVSPKYIKIIDGTEHKCHHLLSDDNQLEHERKPELRYLKYINSFITIVIFGLFH